MKKPNRAARLGRSPWVAIGAIVVVAAILALSQQPGGPNYTGRTSRVVPTHLRRALAARDNGCAFPGCDRPPGWCEAHHIQEWQHGGATALPNLVLMCRFHHRLVHNTEWVITTTRAGPEFTPPKWIDPDQIPKRKAFLHQSTVPT